MEKGLGLLALAAQSRPILHLGVFSKKPPKSPQKLLLKGPPMKSFLFSGVLGFLALAAVNLTASYTGVSLAVTRLSLAVSGFLGVPGVTLLVILNTIL